MVRARGFSRDEFEGWRDEFVLRVRDRELSALVFVDVALGVGRLPRCLVVVVEGILLEVTVRLEVTARFEGVTVREDLCVACGLFVRRFAAGPFTVNRLVTDRSRSAW